jgi:hypothetical protein
MVASRKAGEDALTAQEKTRTTGETKENVGLLRSMLPGTFGVAARFTSDPARIACIPRSSETGETGTVWQRDCRAIDRQGLPAGILLRLGGAADRLMASATRYRHEVTADGMVRRTVHTPLAIPGDDFSVVVDRLPGEGLRLTVDYVTERHFSLQVTGISLSGMGDRHAAALLDHALECRFRGAEPSDALCSLRGMAEAMGFRKCAIGGWWLQRFAAGPPLPGIPPADVALALPGPAGR